MYHQLIFLIYLCIEVARQEKCLDDSSLAVVIDSTKETTPEDLDTQREIILDVVHAVNSHGRNLTYKVHNYNGNKLQCRSRLGLDLRLNIPAISSLIDLKNPKYDNSGKTYKLECAKSILKYSMNKLFKTSANVFGLILAKYESVKAYMSEEEQKKYREGGTYYLALIYNRENSSVPLVPVKKVARRLAFVSEIVTHVLDVICPGTFLTSQISETIDATSVSNSISHLQTLLTLSRLPTSSSPSSYQATANVYLSPTSKAVESINSTTAASERLITGVDNEHSLDNYTLMTLITIPTFTMSSINGGLNPDTLTVANDIMSNSMQKTYINDASIFSILGNTNHTSSSFSIDTSYITGRLHSNISMFGGGKIIVSSVQQSILNGSSFVELLPFDKSSKPLEKTIVNSAKQINSSVSLTAILPVDESPITFFSTQSSKSLGKTISKAVLQRNSSSSFTEFLPVDKSSMPLFSSQSSKPLGNTISKAVLQRNSSSSFTEFLPVNKSLQPLLTMQSSEPVFTTHTSLSSSLSETTRNSIFTSILARNGSTEQHPTKVYLLQMESSNSLLSSIEPSLVSAKYSKTVEDSGTSIHYTTNSTSWYTAAASVSLMLKTSFISLSPSYLVHTKEATSAPISSSFYGTSIFIRNSSTALKLALGLTSASHSYSVIASTYIYPSQVSASQVHPSSSYNSSFLVIDSTLKVIKEINFVMTQNVSKAQLQSFIFNTSNILSEVEGLSSDSVDEPSLLFVKFMEETVLKVGKELPRGENVSISTEEVDVQISSFNPETFNGYAFSPSVKNKHHVGNRKQEAIQLPRNLFKNNIHKPAKVSIMSAFLKTLPAMRSSKEEFKDIGKMFTLSLDVPIEFSVEKPLTYSFLVPENNYSNYLCVYWNSSDWDSKGCIVANVSGTWVSCECTHTTSFSILMQVSDFETDAKHKYALSLITYIGCGASILGCVLLMLTFFMCGRLMKVSRNIIHMNLAFAIAVSNALFLSADSVHVRGLCLGISIAMLYAYLASFFWMLVEGIHVYLMIVKVFKSPKMMKGYAIIGWVLPAVIVAVAALKFHVNFTRDDFCWISLEGNVIWVFVGPVLFIISINIIVLMRALTTSYKMAVPESDFLKLQQVARLTMLLMPIFGVTWVLGVMAVNKQLVVFQYIFTIINSLQGVFIFLCYCLLNNEVKVEYERIKRKYQYGSKATSSYESSVSLYNHLFPGHRAKSIVSMDSSANVRLTRYDSVCTNENGTLTSSLATDSLAKRLKKDYSVELVDLHEHPCKEELDESTISLSQQDNCGLKTYEDLPNGKWYVGHESDNGSCDTFQRKKGTR